MTVKGNLCKLIDLYNHFTSRSFLEVNRFNELNGFLLCTIWLLDSIHNEQSLIVPRLDKMKMTWNVNNWHNKSVLRSPAYRRSFANSANKTVLSWSHCQNEVYFLPVTYRRVIDKAWDQDGRILAKLFFNEANITSCLPIKRIFFFITDPISDHWFQVTNLCPWSHKSSAARFFRIPQNNEDSSPMACDPKSRNCDPWSHIPRYDPEICCGL